MILEHFLSCPIGYFIHVIEADMGLLEKFCSSFTLKRYVIKLLYY